MKRSIVHGTFAAVALACGSLAAYHAFRLDQIDSTNAAIASARVSSFDAAVPEARLARALALARAGESDAAVKAYKALTEGDRRDLSQMAGYNLGNLYTVTVPGQTVTEVNANRFNVAISRSFSMVIV